jgi:hypothetical protein
MDNKILLTQHNSYQTDGITTSNKAQNTSKETIYMKMMITSVALMTALFAAPAFAGDDWENTAVEMEMTSGPLDFTIGSNDKDFTSVEVGYTPFAYTVGTVDADVRFALVTNLNNADTMTLLAQYNASTAVTYGLVVYGTTEVAYTANTSFENGDWSIEPSVGVHYTFADVVGVYGEVGYTWSDNNTFNQEGGYAEIGVPVAVSENMTLTPSVIQTFDTTHNTANAKIVVSFNF